MIQNFIKSKKKYFFGNNSDGGKKLVAKNITQFNKKSQKYQLKSTFELIFSHREGHLNKRFKARQVFSANQSFFVMGQIQ